MLFNDHFTSQLRNPNQKFSGEMPYWNHAKALLNLRGNYICFILGEWLGDELLWSFYSWDTE